MALLPMVCLPLLTNALKKPGRLLARKPNYELPLNLAAVGTLLTAVTPAMCAFWPQMQTVSVDQLEADLAQELSAKNIKQVKFDKGL